MKLLTVAAVAVAPLALGAVSAQAAPKPAPAAKTWQRVHTWEQCLTRIASTHGVCVRTDKGKVYLGRSPVGEQGGHGCVDQPKSAAGTKAVEVDNGYPKSTVGISEGTCADHKAPPNGNTAAPGKDVTLTTPVDWNWTLS